MSQELEDLSQYIVCREDCPLRFLEALAMNGLAKKFEIIDCDKPRFKKIILHLIDGSKVTSQCRFDEEVKISVRIIAGYIGMYRYRDILKEIKIVKESKKKRNNVRL